LPSFQQEYACHSPLEQRWFTMTVTPLTQDGRIGAVITHTNLTERKLMENMVRQLAFYDTLTQLPNRRLLNDRLQQSMATSKRSGLFGALMFLDLDNFKPLNDTHGHDAGDLLLTEVAERLKNCVREMDTVARFGGDEFVVMLSELARDQAESIEQAALVAEKIRFALAAPYRLTLTHEGQADITFEHHCTASIGVTLFVDHVACQEDILKWADLAMYQAKDAGRNRVQFYKP
jgi:diguanylate cyclase (GGDEF)-like protein